MLGHDHALSGALAFAAVAPWLPVSGIQLAVAATLTAGAGILPDLDEPGSTIARTFGFLTGAFAWIVHRLSGGHRKHTPPEALRLWFGEVARYGQLKFGAAEVIHAATSDDEYYEPFVRAIAVLLDHGAADGSVKKGLDPEDVLLQLSVLWRIDPRRGGEARAARILDLIIDGLQARPPGTQ
jgi:hypothetical protein